MAKPLLSAQHIAYTTEQVVDLDLRTRKQLILKNVNLELQPAEFVGLVGPNGAGKSTLCQILSGALQPSSGQLLLDGQNIQDIVPAWYVHQQIAMVFQNVDAQFIGQSFYEDMFLYLANFDFEESAIEKIIFDIADELNLRMLIRQPLTTLSGGQKQLLAIAEALAVNPKILILDEPTAQLDPQNTQLVVNLLAQLKNKKQVTVLLTTHKLAELALTDRLVILNHGVINKSYPTADLSQAEQILLDNQLPVPPTLHVANLLRAQHAIPQTPLPDNNVVTLYNAIQKAWRGGKHAINH